MSQRWSGTQPCCHTVHVFHSASVHPCLCRTASVWAAGSPTPASIVPSSCTTTTAPAGVRWSSCRFLSTVSGAPTSASSFDTAPVSHECSGSQPSPLPRPPNLQCTVFTRTCMLIHVQSRLVRWGCLCNDALPFSKGQRREETFRFRLHPSDERGRNHPVGWKPRAVRVQGRQSFNLVKYSLVCARKCNVDFFAFAENCAAMCLVLLIYWINYIISHFEKQLAHTVKTFE